MKTLILALIFSVVPIFALAQVPPVSDSSICNMDVLSVSARNQARVSFEKMIKDSLKEKFSKVTFKVSKIDKRPGEFEDNDDSGGTHLETDYFLTLSDIRISTVKGNILTVPNVIFHSSDGAKIGSQYDDDEGVYLGQACYANFFTSFDGGTDIINLRTKRPVAKLDSEGLAVWASVPVKSNIR